MVNMKLKYTEILKYIKRGKLHKYIKKNTMNDALPLIRETILQYENVEDNRKDLYLALNSSGGIHNFEVYYNNGNMGEPVIFTDFNVALKYYLSKCKSDQSKIVYNLLLKFTEELKIFNETINTSKDKSVREFTLISREVIRKTKYKIISINVVEKVLIKELRKMNKEEKLVEENIKVQHRNPTESLINMEELLNGLRELHPNAAQEVFSTVYNRFGFRYKDLTILCRDYDKIVGEILSRVLKVEKIKH